MTMKGAFPALQGTIGNGANYEESENEGTPLNSAACCKKATSDRR